MKYALLGDFIGSAYEHTEKKGRNLKTVTSDSRPTDESFLLLATAESIITDTPYDQNYKKWYQRYPNAGYGPGFTSWAESQDDSGRSFGNGAASRASIIGLAFNSEEEVLEQARISAICSHDHPEGWTGAQASALSVFLARQGKDLAEVSGIFYEKFDYLLFYDLNDVANKDINDVSAINTVPLAIFIGFSSKSIRDAIESCLQVGGDVDTIMSIALAIAKSRYPEDEVEEEFSMMQYMKSLGDHDIDWIIDEFCANFL